MKNRRHILIGGILLTFLPLNGFAGEALNSFLSTIEQHTLQSDFVIRVTEEVAQPMNYPGTITMHGRLFRLSLVATEAAYDGKTLYIYDESTDELTLSYPTEEELLEANPFLFAQALVKVCSVSERPGKNGEQVVVTLTPTDQTIGIRRFTLCLKKCTPFSQQPTTNSPQNSTTNSPQNSTHNSQQNSATNSPQYIPVSVEVKEGKRTTLLTLKSPTYTEATPAFTLSYPDAFLNDLR